MKLFAVSDYNGVSEEDIHFVRILPVSTGTGIERSNYEKQIELDAAFTSKEASSQQKSH
jgi:hypothetical protein